MKRKIIRIDEDKCNGCGNCVTSCEEGALAIIDGKAKLVNDVFCDGLGACIGDCPTGALVIEEREAPEFDELAVDKYLKDTVQTNQAACPPSGCPGSAVHTLAAQQATHEHAAADSGKSFLGNWPVQIKLVPPTAPYFKNARILVCADCVPFAVPDFHRRYLKGRVAMVGCPKLDDIEFYKQKLTELFRLNTPAGITVLRMEVPCCSAMASAVIGARDAAGLDIPVDVHVIGIDGAIEPERIPVSKNTPDV